MSQLRMVRCRDPDPNQAPTRSLCCMTGALKKAVPLECHVAACALCHSPTPQASADTGSAAAVKHDAGTAVCKQGSANCVLAGDLQSKVAP